MLGGQPITLENNDVMNLAISAVVVQMPGGGFSTILLPKTLPSSTEAADGALNRIARVASAIASGKLFFLLAYLE
jgi:hypothetical protein